MENGVLAGYPLVDLKAKLYDGSYHEVDSSEAALQVAASLALKNAAPRVKPSSSNQSCGLTSLLQKTTWGMSWVTLLPGVVRSTGWKTGNAQLVHAFVPLSEMFGYATTLRSATQGRGTFTMTFDHYSAVPKSIQEEIIEKNGGK